MGARRRIRDLLLRINIDAHRVDPNSYERRRSQLLSLLAVEWVIDIGANVGQYGQELRRGGYSGAILSVEPLTEAFELLRNNSRSDPQWTCINVALGREESVRTMHIAANLASSSLLGMAPAHLEAAPEAAYVDSCPVTVRRLDDVVMENGASTGPLFLKLDVQGTESDVLAGGPQTVATAIGMEIELSAVELYEGQTTMLDMLGVLHAQGLELWGITDELIDGASRRTLQYNALFVRAEGLK